VICSCAAYLLTCVTGHPFLVVEAAVPFWASLGAGVALASPGEKSEVSSLQSPVLPKANSQ
jgi:hypothetical protein